LASIGNLNIKMSADISGFQTALKTASQLAGNFSRQFNVNQLLASSLGGTDAKIAAFSATLNNMVSQIPVVGGALGGLATGGGEFLSFLTHSTKEMAAQIKTADRLGMDYNEMQAVLRKSGADDDHGLLDCGRTSADRGHLAARFPPIPLGDK